MSTPEPRPRVFISYARSDGEAFARGLRDRLASEGVPLWRDREGMEGGRDWWQQITAAIDRVEFMVLVATPAALQSPLVRREWRYARQRGVAVYPVLAGASIDFEGLPRWMRSVHFYDPAHEWRKFVADLHTRPTSVRVPFMVEDLPPDFVPRPREFDRVAAQLLDREREEPIAITTALRGAGGFGKTALARALCHDEAIQSAYDDGILWVTLGERPGDLRGRVEDLIFMLTGQRPGFAGLDAAVAAFAELLSDRDLLIVIDDVWDAAHVRPFLQGGERCTRIITTRNEDVVPLGAYRVDVDAMAPGEAVALLGHGLPAVDARALAALAQRLGEWPLLLKLVNGAVRERVLQRGQPVLDALDHVNRALDKRGLTFFDARDPQARHLAVASTLGLSLAQLSKEEAPRFDELALFPEDAEIPLATLEALWARTGGLDEFDTETLAERLARMSLLLTLDLSARFVRVHDVVRRYLLERLGERAPALHGTLLETGRPADGWASLPASEPYWWQHLFFHLRAAGADEELLSTALDLRWLSEKTHVRSAFAAESDLQRAQTLFPHHPTLPTLRRVFGRTTHLLADCQSPAEVRATLISRLPRQLAAAELAAAPAEPRLVPIVPLPDLPHPALERTLGNRRGAVRACALSGDGKVVATAAAEGGVTLWDSTGGHALRQLQPDGQGSGRIVRALDLAADGGRLAAATGDRRLWVWDTASGAVVARLQGHTDAVTDCAISADGRWLVSASLDETLRLWDVDSGETVHRLARTWGDNERGWLVPTNEQGHWAGVLGVSVSADGRLAASASADQTVIVWDLDSGRALAVLAGHAAAVEACALSPDGAQVASVGSDRTLRIWNWATREHRAVAAHRHACTACAWSSDGRHIVTASSEGAVRVWNAQDGDLLQTLTGHGGWVFDCDVSAAAGLVVSAGNDGTARLWRLDIRAEPDSIGSHDGAVLDCAAAPDGRHAFTCGTDGQVLLWDMRGQARNRWRAHRGPVRALAVGTAGELATGSADRSMALWDVAQALRTTTLEGHRDSINALAFDPSGPRLASVSNDRTVRLWDLRTRSRRVAWLAHGQWITACAWSPCGRWLVTGAGDGALVRWSVLLDDAVWEAWLTDSRPLSGDRLAPLVPLPFAGHARGVNHCLFTPDGRHLVSASSDATLKVWDADSGTLLRTIEGHLDDVNGVCIDPTGAFVASVSADGGVRVTALRSGTLQMALHVDGALGKCAWVGADRLLAVGARGVYLLQCTWPGSRTA